MSERIRRELFALQDPAYQVFQCRLMPTVPPEQVIGVRMPMLRTLAKTLTEEGACADFLHELPHTYYEENNLHVLLISDLSSYEETVEALDLFLPYVDNWSTCDLISPRSFRTRPEGLPGQIRTWLSSAHTYTVRFALGMLMNHYLEWAAQVDREDYYVRMMVAWYFATALAKQYPAALPYLEEGRLPVWTHNKTIQKAVESYRVTPEHKTYLRTLRKRGESKRRGY